MQVFEKQYPTPVTVSPGGPAVSDVPSNSSSGVDVSPSASVSSRDSSFSVDPHARSLFASEPAVPSNLRLFILYLF